MKATRFFFGLLATIVAVPAFAQTQATNTNTTGATLEVNVNVVKAVRLTLSTGTQCAVTTGATTDYTMSFGTVDALAISNATCGSKFAPGTGGVDAAVYYSDYKLKPTFTSQSTANNTITAYVSTDFATAAGLLKIVQSGTSGSAPGTVTDLTNMSTNSGAQTVVATNAANATEITRTIGVSVAPINGSGTLTGNASATITYTIIVQ